MKCLSAIILFCVVNFVHLQGPGSGINGNLRLCIVEGRGAYKRGAKFCPVLEEEKSGVECVLGTDRLDCLRRIHKGTVDFGVFSPEDLIAAQWASVEVLVTHELRQRPRPYERSVIAVVNRRILPENSWSLETVLRNVTLCHPGVGVNDLRPLSDTLAGYLESLIIPRSCDPKLSLTENKIKGVAQYFGKACKAGPWVPDPARDAELKSQYPSLCAACELPTCSENDRYWGNTGALACLVEGAGDVMWGELDDVRAYFGLNSPSRGGPFPATDEFAFLCRDGTWVPLKGNEAPCVWLNRPWPVIVAKRKASEAVDKLLSSLTSGALTSGRWHGALAALLEAREAPRALRPPRAPLDQLAAARGFREAYSQSGCDPPRHINLCTTSLLEKNKCEWLSEAGAVYGVTPPLQCIVREDERQCLKAVREGESDVTVVGSDWLLPATRDFNLEPILYEATPIVEKMDTVMAYVRRDAIITKMVELRGKRAHFPLFDGLAWHSVMKYLKKTEKLSCHDAMNHYFKEVCAPGIDKFNFTNDIVEEFTKNCYKDGGLVESGEMVALRALVEGKADVSFISMKTVKMYQNNLINEPWASNIVDLVPVCPEENKKYCYITWSNIGHIFANKNLTSMRRHEVTTVFTKLDQLFGKHQPFHSAMFSMYGPFNHQLDILFHNNTKKLATEHILRMHPYDSMPSNFERSVLNGEIDNCQMSDLAHDSAFKLMPTYLILFASLVAYFLSS